MRDIILSSPEQIGHSLEINKDVKADGDFDSIVLTGLGGSGHPGDLLNALSLPKKPLFVHRNYDFPLEYLGNMGFSKTLAIMSSYSGNTEESLTAYEVAKEQHIPILASAAGGKLEEWGKRDGIPFCKIDYPGMQPRHTLFAAFAGIYSALRNSNLVTNIDEDLKRVENILDEKTPQLEAPAKALAEKIKGKIPVFSSSDNLGFATKNLKIQTNENAKHPAFWSTFPELNHNEMVGFSELAGSKNPNQFLSLLIHDPEDHPRNKARMEVTRDFYESWGVQVEEFTAEGDTLLEKLFYVVQFGLWTTYHLALSYDIDPIPVKGVEGFKAKLEEVAGSATT